MDIVSAFRKVSTKPDQVQAAALPAGTTAMFGSSAPLFVAIFSWLWLRQQLRVRQYVGIIVGFVGLALLPFFEAGARPLSIFGVSATLIGSASWAIGSLCELHAFEYSQVTAPSAVAMCYLALVGIVRRHDHV